MPSTNNLAQYFAQQSQNDSSKNSTSDSKLSINIPRSSKSPSPSYSIHSKAVDAEDDEHFENSTFKLKRTRSVGLLDEFIAPTRKLIEEDQEGEKFDIDYDESSEQINEKTNDNNNYKSNTNHNNSNNHDDDDDDDDENQFIEDIDDESYKSKEASNKNPIYSYDDDYNSFSSYDNEDNASISPSPPDTPDLYQPHDDNDIVYEPSRHVDYLSHNWKESDIQKSWRYIVLKRKDVANSARLENASWRTWAQAKYRLKTISPESVNWLKDSDVTWLYGPLYKEPKNFHPVDDTVSSSKKNYGSDSESAPKPRKSSSSSQQKIKGPKPILKKRTVSEMLSQPSMIKLPPSRHKGHSPIIESSHHNLPSPPHIEDDFDIISSRVNAQYKNPHPLQSNHIQENIRSVSSLESVPQKRDDSTDQKSESPAPTQSPQPPQQQQAAAAPPKRHIHFNDRVEQCIAVNIPDSEDDEEYEGDEDDDEANESDSDDDEEGGFFLQVRSPSTPNIHNKDFQLPLSSNEAKNLTHGEVPARYQTIELLPCTTLKHGSDEESDDDDETEDLRGKFTLSHNTNTSRGFNYYYDYNSVYPSDQNLTHVQIGENDYALDENAPQHIEGVKLVDVPENIVMGSNVEIENTPSFAEPALPQKSSSSSSSLAPPATTKSSGAFNLHSDDDSSSDEEQETDRPTTSSSGSSKNLGENLTKVSSSPSYASLSDVAAQGYISQSPNTGSPNSLSNVISKTYNSKPNKIDLTGSNNDNSNNVNDGGNNANKPDVNELQKNFGHLSPSEEKSGFKHTFLNSWKRG